jgi:hypothetical protein
MPHLKLWSPENPKLYKVIIETGTDTVVIPLDSDVLNLLRHENH